MGQEWGPSLWAEGRASGKSCMGGGGFLVPGVCWLAPQAPSDLHTPLQGRSLALTHKHTLLLTRTCSLTRLHTPTLTHARPSTQQVCKQRLPGCQVSLPPSPPLLSPHLPPSPPSLLSFSPDFPSPPFPSHPCFFLSAWASLPQFLSCPSGTRRTGSSRPIPPLPSSCPFLEALETGEGGQDRSRMEAQ